MPAITIDRTTPKFTTKTTYDVFMCLFGIAATAVAIGGIYQSSTGQFPPEIDRRFHLHLGPLPDYAMLVAGGFWALSTSTGALWRLADRRPAVSAGRMGLLFHPSIHAGPVPWGRVSAITIERGGMSGTSGIIKIKLDHRFWSTWSWVTGRNIHFNTTALGVPYDEASGTVAAMLDLRG